MNRAFLAALCAAAFATPSFAQDAGSHFTAAISAGSLGIGPELGYRVSDRFGVRAGASFLNVNRDFDSDDVSYSGKLKLQNYGLMLDLYPMGGHFRISAGARINKNKARAIASPTVPTDIGNHTYTAAQIGTLNGAADVKDLAPALTLGWAGSNRSGLFFGADAGALFQGKARLRRFTASGTAAGTAAFQADLELERLDLQDDIDKFKVYPILQLSLGYRF
jgi:opacity protein-like surface antigen